MPHECVIDGVTVPFIAGQTIAAVCVARGDVVFRTTRGGAVRGMFCGVGVCYDCLVTVNGVPNVRACVVPVEEGDVIDRESL